MALRGTFLALSVLAVTMFVISFFGENAQAQDTGWELTVGAGYSGYIDYDWAHGGSDYKTHVDSGLAVMVNAGYRFTDWFSLNLEQSFLETWYSKTLYNPGHYRTSVFGETALTVRFSYINDAKNLELYLKFGAGAFYGTHYGSYDGWDGDRYTTVDGDYSSHITWVIPMGIGVNYYFNDQYGFGVDVQYDLFYGDGYLKVVPHFSIRF